jgi:hypothetical protein
MQELINVIKENYKSGRVDFSAAATGATDFNRYNVVLDSYQAFMKQKISINEFLKSLRLRELIFIYNKQMGLGC